MPGLVTNLVVKITGTDRSESLIFTTSDAPKLVSELVEGAHLARFGTNYTKGELEVRSCSASLEQVRTEITKIAERAQAEISNTTLDRIQSRDDHTAM